VRQPDRVAHISHVTRVMALAVHSCTTYCPNLRSKTQDDWIALHFVNAIKRTPLSGYAQLRLPCGERVRIDREAADRAPMWFAQFAVNALSWRDLLPCGLVPVPGSACGLEATDPPQTFALADALAAAIGGDVVALDLLRWARPMPQAHAADGTRDPQVLYGRLRARDRTWPIARKRLVLVDDVVATGGHLRAAAAFLNDYGADVMHAICAARASGPLDGPKTAIAPCTVVLPDFCSDPDWLLPEVYDGVEL